MKEQIEQDAIELTRRFFDAAQDLVRDKAVDSRAVTINAVTEVADVMMRAYQIETNLAASEALCGAIRSVSNSDAVETLAAAVNYVGRQTGRGNRG